MQQVTGNESATVCQVGQWRLDSGNRELSKPGQQRKLDPLTTAVLVHLAQHAGRTVSREELQSQVWGRKIVSNEAINRTIATLRRKLDDSAANPRYIETVPKLGYRLIADVEWLTTDSPQQRSISRTAIALGVLAIAAIVFVSSLLIRTHSSGNADDSVLAHSSGIIKVTALTGNEGRPDFSPDGRYIAYQHRAAGSDHWQIGLTDLLSSQVTMLTDSPHYNRLPKWSPDGQWLIFHRWRHGECGIYRLDMSAGPKHVSEPHLLIPCHPHSDRLDLDWAADGQSIYFTDGQGPESSYNLFHHDLRHQSTQQITHHSQGGLGYYALSRAHHSQSLILLRNSDWGASDIQRFEPQTSQLSPLQHFDEFINAVAWQSDDQALLIGTANGAIDHYSLINHQRQPLVSSHDPVFAPATLPQSTGIGFVVGSHGVMNIHTIELANANSPPTILIHSTREDTVPSYANTQRTLVFTSNRDNRIQVWQHDEHAGVKRLSDIGDLAHVNRIKWSTDDRLLLLESDGRVVLVDVARRSAKQLISLEQPMFNVSWLGESEQLLYAAKENGEWQLWQSGVDGTAAQPITTSGAFCAVSDTQQRYLYLVKYHQPGIWRFDLNDQTEQLIINDPEVLVSTCSGLSLRQQQLYYTRQDEQRTIMAWDTDKETTRMIHQRSARSHYHFTVSADGNTIAYASRDRAESAIAMLKPH
ncbi:MAG: hypothetical protein Tsb002_22460 [Wenzhouxiangellaceae bacterium]